MPDLEKRLEHIFSKQLFGIAITELTSLLSRRSVYCSKFPSSPWSAYQFPEAQPQGNIIYQRIQHTWQNGKCIYCGASENTLERGDELETYAYQFIHNLDVTKLFNMKFDVIIGNPPYQLDDGGNGASASPLYHLFIQQAKKLTPRYLTMIIPARWFAGGKGLDNFRDEMLHDNRIREIVDFPASSDCFPSVSIEGGVCYFLWDRDNKGLCKVTTIKGDKVMSSMQRPLLEDNSDIFVRYNEAISILHKVQNLKEKSFKALVSSRKPFGFASNYKGYKTSPFKDCVEIYANKTKGYEVRTNITLNRSWIDQFKVYISEAYGLGKETPYQVLNKPFLGEPNTCCTETYIVIGPYETKMIAENVVSYIKTRFFRFLVLLKKNTQHASRGVYEFVPIQDFSKPWTDEELYAKYGLTQEEIDFIESMIRPME